MTAQFYTLATRLTYEQLEVLRACARGISIRFDEPEIVNALLEGGYAEKNVAGVIAVTVRGLKYLQDTIYKATAR
jgi:hypothetical protein